MATNHLALSDDEFMKQPLPETVEASPVETQTEEIKPQEEQPKVEEPVVEQTQAEEKPVVEDPPKPEDEPKPEGEPEKEVVDSTGSKPEGEAPKDPEPKPETEAAPIDYKAAYEAMLKPIRANGKDIELKSPEELVALAQMGANYTRKMQELAPMRKIQAMLQNNGLLDESKLSFLIDLDKKNPEAIKKLIKDSGIDSLDIDTNTESAYQEGNHSVSDEEIKFKTQLEELGSDPKGKETLSVINTDWDDTSKDWLWQHPEVMSIIHQQRESGIYDQITTEMNRLETLGKLSPGTSFVERYKIVGDSLFPNQGNGNEQPAKPPVKEPAQPVATRTAKPTTVVDNGDKAGAASPSRSAPGKAKEAVNFLAMSDEDFAKAAPFAGRV